MVAEILAVGTEILLGDILNSNAQFLSKELAKLGVEVYKQTTVGDNPERLLNAYKEAFNNADIVITTGGLGPTDDDITKEMGAKYFNKEMEYTKEALKHLENYFKKRGKEMPQTNLKQALMPIGCIQLKNENGTAFGCVIEEDNKMLIMIPGPPNEAIPMFKNEVVPILKKKQKSTFVSKTLHLCGIGEAKAAEEIRELMQNAINPTIAPYAKTNEMLFRITAKAENEEKALELITPLKNKIYDVLGDYIYGEDDITITQAVLNLLKEKKLTVATSESCTGGMLANYFVECAGASEVFVNGFVTYATESKSRLLGVSEETIKKYGVVSYEVAKEMAEKTAFVSNTNVGLSTTGVAGPDGGTKEKPVGLVYIGICINGKTTVRELRLNGNRNKIRAYAALSVITELWKLLKEKN